MSMASNYNTRGRAAEVLVDGKTATLIRRRESIDDQLRASASATERAPGSVAARRAGCRGFFLRA